MDKANELKVDKQKSKKCCLCEEEYRGYGNNPRPLSHIGKCCDKCNVKVERFRSSKNNPMWSPRK